MKNSGLFIGLLLLAALTGAQAQSGGGGGGLSGNTGQQGSSSVNHDRKAKNSQLMGKGVPYSKDAQQQRQIKAKQSGSGTAAAPGQTGRKQGGKLSSKAGNVSSGKTGNSQ